MKATFLCLGGFLSFALSPLLMANDSFQWVLRSRIQEKEGGGFHIVQENASWSPSETAVIVCDMWDAHHCLNATKRGAEMAPRMNTFLTKARDAGAVIIHAPSSCLDFYKEHPARKRTEAVTKAANAPEGISQWLNWLDEREESAGYPIDHSDGGEDDEKAAHDQWAKELEERGRNPRAPWIRQTDLLDIDDARDYITDDGVENWSVLEKHGIKNVLLVGVHLNMCVLGRPFGLRQMVKAGKNVALVRDLTDTMYNPKMPPYVSHFEGTDLVIAHVEKYVCPSITSNQLLGGLPFHFKGDTRKHLVALVAEKEYRTAETVPAFVERYLSRQFRLTLVDASKEAPNTLRGIHSVKDADLLFISVRRRSLPKADLQFVRDHLTAGKPVIGIRTASHAFSLRGKPAPEGMDIWERFDPEVFGGNYRGHHGNKIATFAWAATDGRDHPILNGVTSNEFPTGGSLYQVLPLEQSAKVLLMGRAGEVKPHEPVAWTNHNSSGARAFYTSLGHVKDFDNSSFRQMLANAASWAVGDEVPAAGVSLTTR